MEVEVTGDSNASARCGLHVYLGRYAKEHRIGFSTRSRVHWVSDASVDTSAHPRHTHTNARTHLCAARMHLFSLNVLQRKIKPAYFQLLLVTTPLSILPASSNAGTVHLNTPSQSTLTDAHTHTQTHTHTHARTSTHAHTCTHTHTHTHIHVHAQFCVHFYEG